MGTEVKMMHGDVTELRLGLPGGGVVAAGKTTSGGKRGFSETGATVEEEDEEVELKLNLSGVAKEEVKKKKEINTIIKDLGNNKNKEDEADPAKPPAKAQVVGWPPVRSYRKNILAVQKKSMEESEKVNGNGGLIKVSMDGAPYLRKVDLSTFTSYQDLSAALAKMFSSFTIGNYGSHGMIDFMNESKLMDLLNGSDYVPTYEDKDGDWMLIGDVPWEMFVESCKRLRIMKGKEAVGLAPRAMEKCKSRS